MGTRNRDWAAVKAAYVEGVERAGVRVQPTLEELSGTFGIPLSTLKKQSMTGKWADERNLFGSRLERARQEKTTEVLASKGAGFDALALRVAEKLLAKVEEQVAVKGMTPAHARALSGAAKDALHVGRLVLGDSTDNSHLSGALGMASQLDLSGLSHNELEVFRTLLGKVKALPPADDGGA